MNEKYMENKCLFGIEQEYVIFENDKPNKFYSTNYFNNGKPYKWHTGLNPLKNPNDCVQGEFYCSVGGNKAFGREISNKHLLYCLEAGIHICGTNAEVAPSQWEFQIGTCDMLTVSDDLIVARYILDRVAEEQNCFISLDPKPLGPKWNGSGGHTNFSTEKMREKNGFKYILEACEKLKETHAEHMKVYGKDNEMRLTGIHETSSIDNFSYNVADRSCSIRIPLDVANKKCGYLEDRRPASNLNPYLVTSTIVNTVCGSSKLK
jgi:glutamine synthetase